MTRAVLVCAVLACASSRAHADNGPATFVGWNAAGDFLVTAGTPAALQACTPDPLEANSYPDPDAPANCTPCSEPDTDCKLATPAPPPAKVLVSPDGNAALTASRGCHKGHDYELLCNSWVAVDRLGGVSYVGVESSRVEPKLDVWFRADSRAVMLRFPTQFFVIDLSAAVDPRRTAATEAQAAVAAHVAGLRRGEDPRATADAQFYVDDAARGALHPLALARALGFTADSAVEHVVVTRSASGNSAWVDLDATAGGATWHATELAVRTPAGWRIAGGLWARRGEVTAQSAAPAAVAARRQDVPTELSITAALLRDGDPAFADAIDPHRGPVKLWRAQLAAGVRADRVHGALAPDATTGWLVANIELATKLPDGTLAWRPYRGWFALDADGFGVTGERLVVVRAHVVPLR